jgi:hypothetical protein
VRQAQRIYESWSDRYDGQHSTAHAIKSSQIQAQWLTILT